MPLPPRLKSTAAKGSQASFQHLQHQKLWQILRAEFQTEPRPPLQEQHAFLRDKLQVDVYPSTHPITKVEQEVLHLDSIAFYEYVPPKEKSEGKYHIATNALRKWATHYPSAYLHVNNSVRYIPHPFKRTAQGKDHEVYVSIHLAMTLSDFYAKMAPYMVDPATSHHDNSGNNGVQRPTDPSRDLIPVEQCPPGLTCWPFDLNKVHDYQYRRWYVAQNKCSLRQHIRGQFIDIDIETAWYSVCDLMAFYGCREVGAYETNEKMYLEIQERHEELDNVLRRCRSDGRIIVSEEMDDYIQLADFDTLFLKWIPDAPWTQKIYHRLNPMDVLLLKSPKPSNKKNIVVEEEVPPTMMEGSTDFDITRSCDYVYRAKWLQRCGQSLRTIKNDGCLMVSVVDMINIHGEYMSADSAKSSWCNNMKEKLKDLEIHHVKPAAGGRPVAYVSFLDFELHVLPQIQKGLAKSIASKVYHNGVGVHLGSQRVMDLILDAREQYEQLVISDPSTAAILWELREQYEKVDTAYLDDVYEAKLSVRGPQGLVYLATSAHLNAVKIGHWGGTVCDLRKRYATYFGSSLSLEVLPVADRKAVEKHLHQTFAAFRLENELFRKDKYEEYFRCFNCMRLQDSTETKNDFDITRSCDYVYRAKWLQRCGKSLRTIETDGNLMISVVDMMNIHGDYKSIESATETWRNTIKGKDELKDLKVHHVKPVKGGNAVSYVSFWDFDRLVLPLITKGLAAELRKAWGLIGPAAMLGGTFRLLFLNGKLTICLGSSRLIEIIKDNKTSMLAFVKEDPRAAAILWGQLIEIEKLQETYITPSQAAIRSNPYEKDLIIRDTEQARVEQERERTRQEEEKTKQVTRHAEETTRHAEESTKQEVEKRKAIEAEQLTKQTEEQEATKRLQAAETTKRFQEETQLAKEQEATKRHQEEMQLAKEKEAEATKRLQDQEKALTERQINQHAHELLTQEPTRLNAETALKEQENRAMELEMRRLREIREAKWAEEDRQDARLARARQPSLAITTAGNGNTRVASASPEDQRAPKASKGKYKKKTRAPRARRAPLQDAVQPRVFVACTDRQRKDSRLRGGRGTEVNTEEEEEQQENHPPPYLI